MPLSDAQKIKVRKVLSVHRELTRWPGETPFDILEEKLSGLSSAQIDEVVSLLAEFAKVEFKTGKLSGEYSDDPAETRRLIKKQMMTVVDFDPKDYGIGTGLSVGRA